MNSLPLISHHSFVAAIGNEGRVHEKPRRQEKPSAEVADQAAAIALMVMDEPTPLPVGAICPLRAPASRARA
jgi:hypothetical protein